MGHTVSHHGRTYTPAQVGSVAVAMVLAAPVMPRILSRIGAFWLTVGSVAMMALSLLAIPLSETQLWWGVLRVVFGAGMTALFFLSEFWLVERAPDAIRGRILSIYAVVLSAFYMLGPLLLNVLGTDSIWTFIVPAALIVLGAVPIIAARAEAPDTRGAAPTSPLSILRFFRTDPTLLWGVILFGAIEFGVMGLLSVWALRIGYDQEAAVQMVFWLAFGAFVFQPVLGFAADKFDRRYLMLGAAVVAAIAPMIIVPLALSQSAVFWATTWAWVKHCRPLLTCYSRSKPASWTAPRSS